MTDYFYAGGGIGLGPGAPAIPREPYPRPQVTSRDGLEGPLKKAVVDLVVMAGTFGWTAEVTYARGCFPNGSTGRPGPVKESLAVRLARGAQRAVAVYSGGSTWSWATLALQGYGTFPMRYADLTAFLAGVFGPIHQPTEAAGPMLGPAPRAIKDWKGIKP